jgi:hypothetical protein
MKKNNVVVSGGQKAGSGSRDSVLDRFGGDLAAVAVQLIHYRRNQPPVQLTDYKHGRRNSA